MSLIERIVVQCEWCKREATTNTGDRLKASRLAVKKGWLVHQWDSYGNESHYCGYSCWKQAMELAREPVPDGVNHER